MGMDHLTFTISPTRLRFIDQQWSGSDPRAGRDLREHIQYHLGISRPVSFEFIREGELSEADEAILREFEDEFCL